MNRSLTCGFTSGRPGAGIPGRGQVTTRYQLNRYGDRQLNNALHTVVQSRIQYQQATRD